MIRRLLAIGLISVGLLGSTASTVHATPPRNGCLNDWVGATGTGGDWSDIAGKQFHVDDYLNYKGIPQADGSCVITFAWEEIAFQKRNGVWSTNVDIFQYHHLRFRVWICGNLVQDNNANVSNQPDSGWVFSQGFTYPAGCGPQADNYGYTASNAGSYINEDGIGVTPISYNHYNGW